MPPLDWQEFTLYLTVLFLVLHFAFDLRSVARMRHHRKDWWTLFGLAALTGHIFMDFIG